MAFVSLTDLLYPVGTIYITSDTSFNPISSFGGNWESISASTFGINTAYKVWHRIEEV